jgi:site-specific DNA recombinase
VQAVYDIAGVSGKAVMEHAETKRMLDDVKQGRISGLIFSKLARLTRNARELMDFSDFFRDHSADLISLQENIDTGTPSGRLFYNMVAVMAQWEREEIVDRVRASISVRAKLGKPLNGKAPFGYHWKEKKLLPHPEEGPVRRLMYELFAQHGRKKTVARILTDRGCRTRDGSKWSDTSVGRLIQDPTAKGIHRSNYTRRAAGDKPWALKPEHEWILTPVEALISEELWQK